MSTQNTIIGILGGLAVGALAGVLLAPDRGEKTRAKIAKKATNLKEGLSSDISQIIEDASNKLEALKETERNILDSIKTEVSKAKQELSNQ